MRFLKWVALWVFSFWWKQVIILLHKKSKERMKPRKQNSLPFYSPVLCLVKIYCFWQSPNSTVLTKGFRSIVVHHRKPLFFAFIYCDFKSYYPFHKLWLFWFGD